MRNIRHAWPLLGAVLVLTLPGCATHRFATAPEPVAPALAHAEQLVALGRYADAIVATTEIARKDPLTPGLPELQARIMHRLAMARQQGHTRREVSTRPRMLDDVLARNVLPETYQLKRNVRGETTPLRTAPSRMQAALAKHVTVHLDNVDLAAFAAQIADTEGLNIVADGDLGDGTLTIHAVDTPLIEILEYVGRNLGVTFSVGNNLIWATASQEPQGALPLETRVYRLRKGLAGDELRRPQAGGGGGGGDTLGSLLPPGADGDGGEAGGGPAVIEILGRFVPQPDGADIFFNEKAHVLIAKNTRENLVLTEDLIAALDVAPPQVLIEARFISVAVDDLAELGVDWILDSPYIVTRKAGVVDGQAGLLTRSQVVGGAGGRLLTFPATGNVGAGLTATFQGVLTDPQFRAIIHVLEASGKARTLSVPRVTTINNRPAIIRIGDELRYYEEYTVEDVRTGFDADGRPTYESRSVPSGRPTVEELGIELAVTPSVGADLATINLAMVPEISSFLRWEYFGGPAPAPPRDGNDDDAPAPTTPQATIKLPVIFRSSIDTEVVVRSGETVIMGGLIDEMQTRRRVGVPILSQIPFLGQLFRRDITESRRENLIIFVTATLISDVGEELIPLEEFATDDNRLHDGVGATPAQGAEGPPPEEDAGVMRATVPGTSRATQTEPPAEPAPPAAIVNEPPAPPADVAAPPAAEGAPPPAEGAPPAPIPAEGAAAP